MAPAALGISESSQLLFLVLRLTGLIRKTHCEYRETLIIND